MSSLENYSRIWDGSSSGWVLLRVNRQVTSLSIRFSNSEPNLHEMAALRRALPAFAKLPVSEVRSILKNRQIFDLGMFESREACGMAHSCRAQNLEVIERATDASSYLPFNEVTKQALIIEDNDLNRAVCDEAIRNGVPVKHIET